MYDRSFFQSKVGHAALASIAAMCAFVALSTQMQVSSSFVSANAAAHADIVSVQMVEIA